MAKLNEFGPKPRADFAPLLKASDLTEPVTYTVTAVEVRNLKGEAKPIASFKESEKQWVINPTNIDSLAKKYGNIELFELAGKKLTLAKVATGSTKPGMAEGIRIVGFPA